MQQLTFRIVPDGLLVDVLVNHEAAVLLALQASGQSGSPIETKGLIDTASNVSGVSPTIIRQLGLPPVGPPTTTTGIGGVVTVQLYRVSLHLRDARAPYLPMHTLPSLLVMELPPGLACEVLIGMDVLIGCKLLVDGPAQQFTVQF
jgi:Aspartyl protease